MINIQIANLQIYRKYCTILSQKSPKSRLLNLFMNKFELVPVCRLAEVLSLQITKRMCLQIANPQIATFVEGPQI